LQYTQFNGIIIGGGIRHTMMYALIIVVVIATNYGLPTRYRWRDKPPNIAMIP